MDSHQHEVTCYGGHDDNDLWLVQEVQEQVSQVVQVRDTASPTLD